MYTKIELLKHEGFTEKLIRDLLPEPKIEQNPYNYHYPILTWNDTDVEKAMQTDVYKQWQRERQIRKERRLKRQIERDRAILEGFRGITRHYHVSSDDCIASMASKLSHPENFRGYTADSLSLLLFRMIETNYSHWDLDLTSLIEKTQYGEHFLQIAQALEIKRVYPDLEFTADQIIIEQQEQLPNGLKTYWQQLDL